MKQDSSTDVIVVSLPASFVDALCRMHGAFDASVFEALRLSAPGNPPSNPVIEPTPTGGVNEPSPKKYSAEFLGKYITAWTLPEIFTQIVEMTEQVAPDVLEDLARFRARKRRFVARTREAIHPGNQRLPTLQTASGWWISKNIGQDDLKRALRALARAAGLTFGQDVIFPVTPQAPRAFSPNGEKLP